MNIAVFQFHGCNKCFNETLLLKNPEKVKKIKDPSKWKEAPLDVAICTGYILPEDKVTLDLINKNSKKVIAFGSCAVSGGIFGLAFRNGKQITPLGKFLPDAYDIHGCLGEIEELSTSINGDPIPSTKKLCEICGRKSTCNYLSEVVRQVNLEEIGDTCFNDIGYMCTGYIARGCKENCVKAGAPCRGCKPSVDRASIRMLGMFGTLMGNIEVATEATGKGGTDKLADKDDDVTDSVRDIIGNFFRFDLADSVLPLGKIPSNGSILKDIFVGRLIEELPLILGMMGGSKFITNTIAALEAYENGIGMNVSEKTKEIRKKLIELETQMNAAIVASDAKIYGKLSNEIRKYSGNMNLSSVFFGGFKRAIEGEENYEEYKYQQFEIKEGSYQAGSIKYTLDSNGKITDFNMEGDSK